MNRPRNNYFAFERRDILRLLPPSQRLERVLDVGCGGGATARLLKREYGARSVVGVERDERAAARATAVMDRIFVLDAEVEELPFSQERFDLILMADVLEHLLDPWIALQRYARMLGPHGLLLASVPNVQHWSVSLKLLSGRWAYGEGGLLDRTHLRFFTRRSILYLFSQAGLMVEAMKSRMGPEVKIINALTGGLLRGLLTYQYLIRAKVADAI